jgi:hypothetical protein
VAVAVCRDGELALDEVVELMIGVDDALEVVVNKEGAESAPDIGCRVRGL